MTPRERVMTTLEHREPDRVPVDYWAVSEVTERLKRHFGLQDDEGLLRHLGVDLRYVRGPSYIGLELREHPDGTVEDLWGVRRRIVTLERDGYRWSYKHVVESPLADATTVHDVERHRWPSPDWWDYSTIADECERHQRRGYAVVNAGDRLDRTAQFKPFMYIRGMEQAYIDLIENPKIAEAIIAHIRDYFLEYNRRVFEAAKGGIDIFMMGDDFGTQHGLMMDVERWRRFFKPGFKAFIELAHSYGIRVMHHTCGSVVELIPEFIECGLDILQSLQPRAAGMDLAKLKREYGRYLCFHGGIDVQHTLPYGTTQEVREMVRRQMEAGKPGGGFIVCTAHNILPETPTENIIALFESYREFGRY
jgi:uroporphyrinogen decarboxylase